MSCVYVIMFWCFFFFFKQKTAYEMRISDWSSDVCSSDLQVGQARRVAVLVLLGEVEDPAVHRRHEAVVSAGAIGRPRPVALGGARGAADLVDERLVTGDVDLPTGQRAGLDFSLLLARGSAGGPRILLARRLQHHQRTTDTPRSEENTS